MSSYFFCPTFFVSFNAFFAALISGLLKSSFQLRIWPRALDTSPGFFWVCCVLLFTAPDVLGFTTVVAAELVCCCPEIEFIMDCSSGVGLSSVPPSSTILCFRAVVIL